MAFDPRFLEELRQRVPLNTIIGRKTKIMRSGRNWKACCPFHGEKTPSFYIYDDHFHCYGCGVHGDVISFVMQNEGRTFSEAITELAGIAGLEVPEQTPQQKQKIERQHTLYDVMEAAQDYYCAALETSQAKAGKEYLLNRGITPETCRKFRLGWSGDGRGGLVEFLRGKGYDLALIGDAGLLRRKSETEWGNELFFNRVIYPIHDRKGRPIAFGGRILGEGQPKYLNSPETLLFAKRRTLYGIQHLASLHTRKDARKEESPLYNTVLVVEGYMDVIALHQAGFHGAVAPLGTALTQDQMQLLWRTTAQPVLCFDGDKAGQRAMLHAAEEALPLLTSEHTLNFLVLPEKDDPDSFIRQNGAKAFLKMLERKQDFSDTIYRILSENVNATSPEQRAALRTRLVSFSQQIKDTALSKEYRRILLDRFYTQYYQKREWNSQKRGGGQECSVVIHRPVLNRQQVDHERICILFAILIHYPSLLPDVERALGQLNLSQEFVALREALFEFSFEEKTKDDIIPFLEDLGLKETVQTLMEQNSVVLLKESLNRENIPAIEKQWWHFYGLLNLQELEQQVQQARDAWNKNMDEAHMKVLISRIRALEMVKSGGVEEEDEDFL